MGTVASDGGAPSILTVERPGRPNLTLTSLDGSLGPNRDRTQGLGSEGVGSPMMQSLSHGSVSHGKEQGAENAVYLEGRAAH